MLRLSCRSDCVFIMVVASIMSSCDRKMAMSFAYCRMLRELFEKVVLGIYKVVIFGTGFLLLIQKEAYLMYILGRFLYLVGKRGEK